MFTRDLRVHDNPVLHAACHAAAEVVPVFVLDTAILRGRSMSPNRAAFLAEALADLDTHLRELGGHLVLRSGDVAKELERLVADLGAAELHLAADVSGYSQRREQVLRERLTDRGCRLRVHAATITVVEPGAITPSGGGAQFAVFTPYYRRWLQARRRGLCEVPRRITVPAVATDPLPSADDLCSGQRSPHLPRGGEAAGRRVLRDWLAGPIAEYDQAHDDLAADATSRLSAYLHFGFFDLLVDADVANNQLNWQWVAGTGTDTRPNRVLNPLRQAQRYDPTGDYVRRYLPELRGIPGPAVHEPWKLDPPRRASLDYPEPIIDLREGVERFHAGCS